MNLKIKYKAANAIQSAKKILKNEPEVRFFFLATGFGYAKFYCWKMVFANIPSFSFPVIKITLEFLCSSEKKIALKVALLYHNLFLSLL